MQFDSENENSKWYDAIKSELEYMLLKHKSNQDRQTDSRTEIKLGKSVDSHLPKPCHSERDYYVQEITRK